MVAAQVAGVATSVATAALEAAGAATAGQAGSRQAVQAEEAVPMASVAQAALAVAAALLRAGRRMSSSHSNQCRLRRASRCTSTSEEAEVVLRVVAMEADLEVGSEEAGLVAMAEAA